MDYYSLPNISLDKIRIPDFIPNSIKYEMDTPDKHMWADDQFEVLKKYIQEFEQSLDAEHEVGIMMTNFGQSVLMKVTQIACEYPVLMVFKGYVNNQEATLIQHINQLNFLLTVVRTEPDQPKRQIGFVTNQNVEA